MTKPRLNKPHSRHVRDYHVRGRLFHGRSLVYAPDLSRRLPDFECAHGRLEGDRTEPCGCWNEEVFVLDPLGVTA